MSKRKAHNLQRRLDRVAYSMIASHNAAVVAIDPSGRQVMIDWRKCRQIRNVTIANALCDIPHRWTIYIAAFGINELGDRYMKSKEIQPVGMYRTDSLNDVIEHFYDELRDGSNPNHHVAMGWLAVPALVEIEESQASAVFEAAGVWRQQKIQP
ncbi:hypothetical protein [Pseudomonas sp. B26(2017)]|uniref:hypothetical protein n=1 Tax=Pseudomonas sp. B26(2017) TaxID=1981732 RepID=UPI000A1F5542|nr:hypothetical protein [Pseudomonas sp. B26(2017)]